MAPWAGEGAGREKGLQSDNGLTLRDAMPLKAAKIRQCLESGERLVKHPNWRIQDLVDTANSITAQNEWEQFVLV